MGWQRNAAMEPSRCLATNIVHSCKKVKRCTLFIGHVDRLPAAAEHADRPARGRKGSCDRLEGLSSSTGGDLSEQTGRSASQGSRTPCFLPHLTQREVQTTKRCMLLRSHRIYAHIRAHLFMYALCVRALSIAADGRRRDAEEQAGQAPYPGGHRLGGRDENFDAAEFGTDVPFRRWMKKESQFGNRKIDLGVGLPPWRLHVESLQVNWLLRYLDAGQGDWKLLLDNWLALPSPWCYARESFSDGRRSGLPFECE